MSFFKNFVRSPWDDPPEKNIFSVSKKGSDFFNFNLNQYNMNYTIIYGLIVILVLIWLASGFYSIKEGSQAIITRFGKFNRLGLPGLNYHLPAPLESKIVAEINRSRRIEIGYRSNAFSTQQNIFSNTRRVASSNYENSGGNDILSESIMLTGDENIIELNADVMWHISNFKDYVFNVRDPDSTVKAIAESAIREIIGNSNISSVLSDRKQEITEKIERLIQSMLDQYNIGVELEQVQLLKAEPPKEVIKSYRDVQTSKADKEKEINQAQSYSNDVLPKARGEASKIFQESEAYKEQIVLRAKGEVARFNSIYSEYINFKQITKDRLGLEMISSVLERSNIYVMDTKGLLPHMDILKQLENRNNK